MDRAKNLVKNKSDDRVLVLKPIEGMDALSNKGMVDKRLFSRENNLHAIMDKKTTLWGMQMDHGLLPQQLAMKFTSFPKLLKHATEYYRLRNIEIKEVID